MAICLYPKDCTDFSANGLGVLTPLECRVTEEACGMFELELVQPIDDTLRWAQLEIDCLIKADVPTRESPLYEEADGQDAWTKPVTVTRNVWTVSGTTVGEYMRSGPGTNYKNYGYLKNGAKVTEIGRQTVSGRTWLHVIVQKGGRKCWMSDKWLTKTGTVTETLSEGGVKAASPQGVSYEQSREQLFRIYSVERDAQRGAVTARAMHVFYDLRGNLVNKNYEAKKADAKQVIKDIFADLNAQSDFEIHVSEGVSGKVSGDYGWKNPVECLLDPDEGILPQAKATLVRDNFDVYILPDFTRDSNVTIRRGKNLKGVTVSWDAADIVTRVIPCGRNKKGNPLFLDGDVKHVDSPHVGEHPHPLAKKIDYDVRVIEKKPDNDEDFDKDTMFLDAESARKKLRELAEAEFSENGIDLPSYGMDVDFIMLSGEVDNDDYAGLQSVFLNDTVTVIDSVIGLTAKLRVTGYTWDALAKQYESVTLGDISDLKQTVYSYNLPTGGVSGSKIASGSLSGTAIRDATIDYAKIAVATIQQLTADSIVALTARIDEIVAGKITTDELYASFAEFLTLHVQEIVAGSINTDKLKAAFAELQVLIAGTATFDRATIRQLVAKAMTLEYGVGDQMFISNLAVSFAQMVGATIGDLVIKASDGKYYHLDVNEEGNVTATERTVTEGESLAGMTDAGEVILGTHITATNLNTKNLLATYALISQIDAARINVDELFAREAFIQLLRTTKIVGQDSIEIIAESSKKGVEDVDVEFYLSDSPTTPVGGEWISEVKGDIPEGKYLWHHTKTTMKDGSERITGEQYTSTYEGVVGPQGAGIDHVEEYFGLSTKSTEKPTSWQQTTPTMDATNRYLWNYEKFVYTAGDPQQTTPRIIGVYGDKGTGLSKIVNYYLISDQNKGITRDTEGWTTTVQTTTVEKPYLWNYEEMVWSDGSRTYTEPAVIGSKGEQGLRGLQGPAGEQGIPGPKGDPGTSGKGVNAIEEEYYLSTSNEKQTGGEWSSKCPAWKEGCFLWTRSKITWSEGDPTTTTPVLAEAINSANNAQYGGRNLYKGTKDFTGSSWYSLESWTKEPDAYNGFTVYSKSTRWGGLFQPVNVAVGETYVFSFYAKASAKQAVYTSVDTSTGAYAKARISPNYIELTTEWKRYSSVFTITGADGPLKAKFECIDNTGVKIYACGLMLERGNKATDWSPAPEDMDDAVVSADVEYYLSESTTELKGGSWQTVAPEWVNGKYMWSRTTYITKGGEIRRSPETCIAGAKGENGKTTYFHIKYSAVENPTTADQMTEDPSKYIGTYVDFTEADSNDPKAYKWMQLEGAQGPKGDQGVPGVGKDGKTYYLHIKYANKPNPASNEMNDTGGSYIGIYTDLNELDSSDPNDYKWSKIKGEDGKSIDDIVEEYYLSTSSETPIGGSWLTICPSWTPDHYIWTRSHIYYTDKSDTTTAAMLDLSSSIQYGGRNLYKGTKDFTGSSWYSLQSWTMESTKYKDFTVYSKSTRWGGLFQPVNVAVGETYVFSFYAKASAKQAVYTSVDTSTGKYATAKISPNYIELTTDWKRYSSVFTVTGADGPLKAKFECIDDTGVKIYTCGLMLERGNKATDWSPAPEDTDDAVVSADVEYYLSTSTTSATGGSWSTTAPTWVNGRYMWSRTKYVTKGGQTRTSKETCIAGAKGDTGANGRGVSKTYEQFYLSTSNTEQTGGNWVNECPEWKEGYYIWTRIHIDYTDGGYTNFEAVLSDSNNLMIGGRNLYTGTKDFTGSSWYSLQAWTKESAKYKDFTVYSKSTRWGGLFQDVDVFVGETYVFSFYAKASAKQAVYTSVDTSTGAYAKARISPNYIELTTEWKRYSSVFTITGADGPLKAKFECIDNTGVKIYTCGLMLERGNTATDWSPSPEDMVTQPEMDTYLRVYSESEANSKGIAPGVYVGLMPSGSDDYVNTTQAVINARGSFEVHQNGKVASSIGVERITLGNLVLYKTSSGSVAFDYGSIQSATSR